jgi:hypothetical protein
MNEAIRELLGGLKSLLTCQSGLQVGLTSLGSKGGLEIAPK